MIEIGFGVFGMFIGMTIMYHWNKEDVVEKGRINFGTRVFKVEEIDYDKE